MSRWQTALLLSVTLVSACGPPARQCLAPDCGCEEDADCAIDACNYYDIRERDDCERPECDCTNGYPVPVAEQVRLAAQSEAICGGSECGGCDGAECGADWTRYKAACRSGRCVGIVVDSPE